MCDAVVKYFGKCDFFLTVFIELKTSFGKCDDYYTFSGLSV